MKKTLIPVLFALMTASIAMGQDDAAAEQRALQTESYQLFAIDDSGISGTLNITSRVEGGTQFVVTLVGINEGHLYLPVLFAGDCGPERERVAELPPVGSLANDPYSSISDVSLDFAEVSQRDYFLYIFDFNGEQEGEPLACGEVGEDANR